MKVLVTGGGGFIGSFVVKELLKHNCEVIVYDIVSEPFIKHDNVQYVHGTILDKLTLCKHMEGCDAVFHLAALLGVKRVAQEQLRCLSINIEGTLNVLEACVMEKINYILFTSSSEIYGDICNMNSIKIGEENTWNPKSNYAVTKLVGEKYIKAFHEEYGIEYNIIRFFNVYGPGQIDEFVVPKFVKLAMDRNPLTIYGDGKQIRSFCFIEDATKGLIETFMNIHARNQIFNIGNDREPITITELAKKVLSKTNSESLLNYISFEQSDRSSSREIYKRIPDINKAKSILSYNPIVSLDDGIDKIIKFGKVRCR